MKKLSVVIPWLLFFGIVWGVSIFSEYFSEHKYYYEMLSAWSNRWLLVWWIVAAAIPVSYKALVDKATTKWMMWSSAIALLFFAYAFIGVRDTFVWSAFIALWLNISLMIGWAWLMIGGMWSGGSMIYRCVYHQDADTLDRAVTALILWFVAALAVSWVLVMTTLLYQIVAVACLVVCGYLIYREHHFLKKLAHNTSDLINTHLWFDTWAKTINTILFALTLIYIAYGIMLAYIPYPTAWDANHAYMYIPKVWAEHHGYLWNSLSAQFGPSPWLTYIAVWFQFWYAFQSIGGWIWPDTWAVVMNYLISVPVVMVMIWWLIRRVISYMKLRNSPSTYQLSWAVLLSWLTSGMGAFLVFVDNKSDFGVLAITLCALVLLFDWLPPWKKSHQEDEIKTSSSNIQAIVLSGLVAGVAIFAKPTSLFDFATIVVLFAGIIAWTWAMVGTWLLVVWAMALMKITTVPLYLSGVAWWYLIIAGLLLIVLWVALHPKSNISKWKWLVIRWATMIWLLIIVKTPLMLWRQHSIWSEIGWAKWYVQGILMGYNGGEGQEKRTSNDINSPSRLLAFSHSLLAQSSSTAPSRSCTLQSEWLTQATLYDATLKATTEWAGEDLGRYIGYGGKTRDAPWWRFVIADDTCIALDHDARVLCTARLDVQQGKFAWLDSSLNGDALQIFASAAKLQEQWLSASYIQQDLARQLTLYRQDKALLKSDDIISVPYRWIVPLNMTYNWSLQNLSSYYTDVGVVWLVLLVVLLTSMIWLLIYHPRRALIPVATVIAWLIWWVSGSSILWYGIGLIIWTMLSMMVTFDAWTDEDDVDPVSVAWIQYGVLWVIWVIMIVQLLLNFIRIGSQGGGWIFVQYKTANGMTQIINDQLQPEPKINYGLSGKEIFDMQFPHYNKTIAAIDANPDSKQAVLIAGTYMPYFVYNQYNIIQDGFLTSMREWFSDGDVCRSYLRLQDKDLTYLVIDPNIASVVMGEWNTTLRDRMFAKIDPVTGKIIQDGAISMLANLVSSWYIDLFNTNNIAAKYAFTLSDADMMTVFGVAQDDIALTRTKLATARFWWDEGNGLLQKALQIMWSRFTIPQSGLSDIADIFGKDVDVPKLAAVAQQVKDPSIVEQIKQLNQDERYVLANYLSLLSLSTTNPQQYQQSLVWLLQQSIGWWSQLIVFKVK